MATTPTPKEGTSGAPAPINLTVQQIRAARAANFSDKQIAMELNRYQQAGGSINYSPAVPTDKGLGPATTMVKNPDGTTTTSVSPGYGSQSVGGARAGISSAGPTTTTSGQGTPSSVGNTGGTGIGTQGSEFNKKKMWDDTIDTSTGLPVGYGRQVSIGEGLPPIQSNTVQGGTSGLTEPTPEEKAASNVAVGEGNTTNQPNGDIIDTSTGLPVSEGGKKKAPIDESKPTTDAETGAIVPVMPQSEDEAFAILQNGGKLPVNRETAIWENRYAQFQDLNGQDSSTIASMVANGDIAPRYLDYMRKYSPAKYAEIEKKYNDDASVNSINSSSQNLFNTIVGDKKTSKEPTRSEMIQLEMIKEFNATAPSVRDLKAKYYEGNDALKESKIKMAEMETTMETTKEEIAKIYQTYRTQYPDAPQAFIVGMAEKASDALNQKLTREMKEYNIEYAKYKAEKDDIDTELKFDEMLIKEERDNRADKLDFLNTLYTGAKADEDWDRSKEFEIQKIKDAQAYGDKKAEQEHTWRLSEIENAQGFQREEMQFQAQQNQLQRDQAMEIVQMQMKNAGREVVGKAEDGSWYDVMDKDGKVTRKTADELISSSTPAPGTYKPGNANISFNVDDNGDTTFAIQGYGTGSVMKKEDGKPAECAGFTNRITGEYGLMKDYYADKAAQIDTQDPKAGDVFISSVGVKDPNKNYGHVGMVNKVVRNPDGSVKGLWISDANVNLDNKIRNNVYITKGDKIFDTIQGYHQPNYKKGVEKAQVATLSDKDINSGLESLAGNVSKMTGKNEDELMNGLKGKILDYGAGSTDVKDYVYSAVAKTIEGEAGKNYLNTGGLVKTLDALKSDVQAYQGKYPDSGGLGNAVSLYKQYIANTAQGKQNSPQVKEAYALMDRITREMQLYRQSTTGAAFGVKEMAEFKDLFPLTKFGGDVKVSSNLTVDKLENLIKISQQQLDSKAELILGKSAFNKIMKNEKPKVNINNLTVDRNFMTSTPSKEKYGYEDWSTSPWFTNYFNQ